MVAFADSTKASFAHSRGPLKAHTPESDLQVSGLRYYNPELGRWVSRDPAEERAGLNLYVSFGNAPIHRIDLLGLLIPLNPPATPSKCALVNAMMAIWSASTPVNHFLWNHWLGATGSDVTMAYGEFDTGGAYRIASKSVVDNDLDNAESWAAGLSCNQSGSWDNSFTWSAVNPINVMIFAWSHTTDYTITYGKNCDGQCCTGLWGEAEIDWSAYDRTDFNNGDTFPAPPFTIADQLVNECFNQAGVNDFDIRATDSVQISKTWDCP